MRVFSIDSTLSVNNIIFNKHDFDNQTPQELLSQMELLQQQVHSLENERSKLHESVLLKESEKKLLGEEKELEKQSLEKELQKEKRNVVDLMALLEGVSTNSDQLPTGQVFQTMNAPLDSYLLKRTASNDSVHEVEDLQSDLENSMEKSEDISESGNTSYREQMNHTIGKYENQIKELELLYDRDVEALESENRAMKEQICDLKRQLKTSGSSNKFADLNAEEVEISYQRKISDARKEHKLAIQQTQKEAASNIESLLMENEKLNKLLQATEERYAAVIENMREEFLSMSTHQADFKINDIFGKKHLVNAILYLMFI